EDGPRGAARERLDTERAGAGVEVQHHGAVNGPDQAERRLADEIGGRARDVALRRSDPPPSKLACNDPHSRDPNDQVWIARRSFVRLAWHPRNRASCRDFHAGVTLSSRYLAPDTATGAAARQARFEGSEPARSSSTSSCHGPGSATSFRARSR